MSRAAISEDTPVKLRPAYLWALLGAAAVAGGGWATSQVQIEGLKASATELKATVAVQAETQSADHDLLVRIDERTAEMKKILDRLVPGPVYPVTTPSGK